MLCCTFCYTESSEQTGKSYVLPPAAPAPRKEHAGHENARVALPNLLSRAPTNKRRVQPTPAWEPKVASEAGGRPSSAPPAQLFNLSALPTSISLGTAPSLSGVVVAHTDELELGLDRVEARQDIESSAPYNHRYG